MMKQKLDAFCTAACLLVAGLACLYPVAAGAHGEPPAHERGDVIDRLLALPAPARDWRPAVPSGRLSEEGRTPPDDAPLQALVAFWVGPGRYGHATPSPAVRLRLLGALEQDPSLLDLLRFVPDDAASLERVHALYERQNAAGAGAQFKAMRRWLMLHGPWYRDELAAAARKVRYEPDGGYFEGDEDLRALARLDAPRAAPILADLSAHANLRLRTLALAIRYGMQAQDPAERLRLRRQLQATARDHAAPPLARDTAIKGVFATPWDGQEAFFDELAQDKRLMDMTEGSFGYSPLAEVVEADPGRWIPHAIALVQNRNRAVHDNAVACLVQFHLENTREDALRPLVPWLADPSWSGARDRLRLIQSLDRIHLKEALPGLLKVIERENGFELAGAADALAKWPDPRAIPLLRAAFLREPDSGHRRDVLHALIANHGLDTAWATHAIEVWAALPQEQREAFYPDDFAHHSPEVSAGGLLARSDEVPEPVIASVIARAAALEKTQPQTAASLREIVAGWKAPLAARWLVDELAQGRAGSTEIAALVSQRTLAIAAAGERLRALRGGHGTPRGVAVALSGSGREFEEVLAGPDVDAARALLATARLARTALPLAPVGALLRADNARLRDAAERFLDTEDSNEARRLIRAAHPGEFLVFGSRSHSDPGHVSFGQLDMTEQPIAAAIRAPGGPDAVYSLSSGGYWSAPAAIQVRVRGRSAELIKQTDGASWAHRPLSAQELAQIERFIADEKVEELPPLITSVADGVQYEFMALDRTGGYRLFMNNPGVGEGPGSVYARLTALFHQLAAAQPLKREFAVTREVQGARLLLEDPALQMLDVWADDGGVRALAMPTARDAQRVPAWHSVGASSIGPAVAPPAGYRAPAACGPAEGRVSWASRAQGVTVAGAQEGLLRCEHGGKPKELVRGWFSTPVLSPDGRWAVVARTKTNWADPNDLVRVDVQTGKLYSVAIAPADNLEAVVYVPAHRAVLVWRARDSAAPGISPKAGPDQPEFFLLDPANGKVKRVAGDFAPLTSGADRPLQPTGQPDETWAALPGPGEHETVVGRYDTRRFVFTPVATYPWIEFGSDRMWVDEPTHTVYVAFASSILALPLNAAHGGEAIPAGTRNAAQARATSKESR